MFVGGLAVQMTRNPGYYGLQLRTSDPAAVKAAIRDKFINTALKQLADHGLVRRYAHESCNYMPVHLKCFLNLSLNGTPPAH